MDVLGLDISPQSTAPKGTESSTWDENPRKESALKDTRREWAMKRKSYEEVVRPKIPLSSIVHPIVPCANEVNCGWQTEPDTTIRHDLTYCRAVQSGDLRFAI